VTRVCAAFVLSAAVSAVAADLPAWHSVGYELRSFGVTARSVVTLEPGAGDALALTATSAISDNRETVEASLGPCGQLRRRTRFSAGRNQRFKSWEYGSGHVLRVRREPPRRGGGDPHSWPESSRQRLAYPEERQGRVLTDPYALLLFGGWLLDSAEPAREVLVQTDRNFYLVELTRQTSGGAAAQAGGGPPQSVLVKARPVGAQPDKPDFSLLGLTGDITLQYDAAGVPRAVRGRAPRIGVTTLSAIDVRLREQSPGDSPSAVEPDGDCGQALQSSDTPGPES
jgi:hypothetical protein